jgi:hypothetical protein
MAVLLEGRPGEIYNIGADGEMENIAVVELILETLGKPHDLISYVADRPVMRIPFASCTQWRVARGVRLSVAAGNDVARRTIRLGSLSSAAFAGWNAGHAADSPNPRTLYTSIPSFTPFSCHVPSKSART